MSIQPSLDLLDRIFLRARENAARAVGEDVLAGAEVFLNWVGGKWWVELTLSHCIAEKFNIWLSHTEKSRDVYCEFCHEFAHWCPPIDRGMMPSQLNGQSKYYQQFPESVVWLGPLVSFEDTSRTRAAREIFKKPKAVELLLLGFTNTQLQVVDNAIHIEAMAAAHAKNTKITGKLNVLQKRMAARMKAGNLSKAELASLTASMISMMDEKEKASKEADDAGRTLVPVLPFSAESLEELEMKLDLFS